MKKILVVSSFLVMLMFLVACTPKVSDQAVQRGLQNLSDEELDAVIEESGKEDGSLAGQAVFNKIPPGIRPVSNQQLLVNAQALKIKRLEEKLASVIQPPDPAQDSGVSAPGEAEGFNPQPEPPKTAEAPTAGN
jgi:hypothetical protein